MTKYKTPTIFVDLLNAKNVYAGVPEALEANAHRMASKSDRVNSARQNIDICEATLRTRILLSGFSKINFEESGFSSERLYAKKTVNIMETAERKARSNVSSCRPRGP